MRPARHNFLSRLLLALGLLCASPSMRAQTSPPANDQILTNGSQVVALSLNEAGRYQPVRLRGVVIWRDGVEFTVMSDSVAVFMMTVGKQPDFKRGDLVEVEGSTEGDRFAPYVKTTAVRVVGTGKIPEPKLVTFDELLSGRLEAQWVEITGVVRRSERLNWGKGYWALEVATGGGRLLVRLPRDEGQKIAVDSEVRLRGTSFCQFNQAHQATRPTLFVPPGEPVIVKQTAPANAYKIPTRTVVSLMQFNLEGSYGHRVRVQGVVMYAEPGEGFWIHDAEKGLRVISSRNEKLEIGEEVEVIGFLNLGGNNPILEDAEFKWTGRKSSVQPVFMINAVDALNHDADLVAAEGIIQERWTALDGYRLRLQAGTNQFVALMRMTSNSIPTAEWLPGSRIRVVGICSVNVKEKGVFSGMLQPQSFQILLRSPADVQILQPPPWWTPQRVAWCLGIFSGALLLVMTAVMLVARRRLQRQALERIKSEAEFSAVWNERNRMARELHDTLAQGLGAISMQLEVVKRQLPPDSEVRKSLDEARTLTRSSLSDARNSIWNMRSQVLESGDLAAALKGILQSLPNKDGVTPELRVIGEPRRLAPVTENNLLRIGQEAISNAAKYARAKRIEVVLEFAERQVRLSVSDDGQGFDPEHPPASEGGFGLVGMRERATELNGEFTVSSAPGKGTVIRVMLPLTG